MGINDQSTLGNVLAELSKEIEPSIIGSINRTHSLIRSLAKKLLGLHKKAVPEHQSKALIEHLTEKLFSHTHLISSSEAKEIGFGDLIETPDSATEKLISDLSEHYTKLMKLQEPLVVEKIVKDNSSIQHGQAYSEDCVSAVIHSSYVKYKMAPTVSLNVKNSTDGKPQVNISLNGVEWVKE